MKNKPWSIVVLATLHWLSPLGNIFINSWRVGVSIQDFIEALVSPSNWMHLLILVFLPVLSGVCIFMCRKWSYAVYIALMVIPFFYSFATLKGDYQATNLLFTFGLYFINIILVGYFLLPNIRTIYFNPKVRWWQSHPRFLTELEAKVLLVDRQLGQGLIKNISLGGFFVEMAQDIELNTPVKIEFQSQGREFSVLATPVFRRASSPEGYGFKIEDADSKKSGIRELVKSLRAQGALVQGRAPGPEDGFVHWMGRAWRSREAWVPTLKN